MLANYFVEMRRVNIEKLSYENKSSNGFMFLLGPVNVSVWRGDGVHLLPLKHLEDLITLSYT